MTDELANLLLKVEKPARYAGGEFGQLAKKEAKFKTIISFPDLYEIGMGNQALRIIYNRLNKLPGILCDRAFAPAPDFEKLLRENEMPLYGLETGLPLFGFDLVLFTLGYELGLNGVLTILDTGGIPLRCDDRGSETPVVIAGGPVASNPLPFSPFIDAFWIGEAEAGFFDLAQELSVIKEKGRGGRNGRAAIIERISEHPNIWVKGKKRAVRAVYTGFSSDEYSAVFPIPGMKIVQNHGTVEIMRGCPNGCRFCHAGFWYRPMRQKKPEIILQQAEDMAREGGWQQISLSSLSSGDYCGVSDLVETLNEKFLDEHVSFQLPSLKVSGFSLEILEKVSVTRKSGLTFAVETPLNAWQMSINKEATKDSVAAILEEAKKRGWKSAKFYFMIGLPVQAAVSMEQSRLRSGTGEEISEEKEIVEFINDISVRARMKFNINVGVFIPKPHTPYQWAAQIDTETAKEKLFYIRSRLKPLGHKVSISDLLISQIEGLLSRGDERAGYLCEKAYLSGSRLDAWDEYLNREKWKEILKENDEYVKEILFCPRISSDRLQLSGQTVRHGLSWNCIESGVRNDYLQSELNKSYNCQRTDICSETCKKCGICNDNIKIDRRPVRPSASSALKSSPYFVNQNKNKVNNNIFRLLFSFSKEDSAVFYGHLSLIEIFSMSLRRASIPVLFTRGFNPLAKMEFASPLSTGIKACNEIASADFLEEFDSGIFIEKLNKSLPCGIRINRAECFYIPHGVKQHSLASLLWGFSYKYADKKIDYIPYKEEKNYRACKDYIKLCRYEVLAIDNNCKPGHKSYLDVYRSLYDSKRY